MAIETKEIRGSDTLAGSRIVINENFQILSSALNVILQYVNTDNKTISNIEKLNITKGTVDITETLVDTNGSISLGGNLLCRGGLEAISLTLSSDLTVDEGDFTMNNPNSSLILLGNMKLDGEYILTDYTTTKIDASNLLTFENFSGNDNIIYDGELKIGGKLSPTGRSAIVLSWESFVDTYENGEEQFYLNKVQLKTGLTNIPVGQILKIVVLINEDLDLPYTGTSDEGYWLTRDCLEYTTSYPITKGIKFTKAWQNVELVYNGVNWVILNVYGAEVV